MSSPTLCFLTMPEYPLCPAPDHPGLISPVTEDPESDLVLDLSLKKRPCLDSTDEVAMYSPRRRADSGDEYWSQDEFHGDAFNRQDAPGGGTYKKHLLKRYRKFSTVYEQ